MAGKPERTVTITVNQDDHEVAKEKISYEEVVALYLSDGGSGSNEYLIKYSRGKFGKRERHARAWQRGDGERWHAF